MKRMLVVFRCYNDYKLVVDNFKVLEDKFNFKMLPLYIRELNSVIPVENALLNTGIADEMLKESELEYIEQLEEYLKLNGIKEKLIQETGYNKDIIEEYLKEADCILLNGGNTLSEIFLETLKISYKPVLIVNDKVSKYDNIAIVSDDGIKINKSVSSFINIFENKEHFTMLMWNYKNDKNHLLNYLEDKNKFVKVEDCRDITSKELFLEKVNKYDFVIMGNLSRSFFVEKITKRMGVNLMENIKGTIFIG